MSKFTIFFLVSCAAAVIAMKGGVELKQTFPYFVYFLTSENFFDKGGSNATKDVKWLYCMGVLIEPLRVLTAEMCSVEANGKYWAAGSGASAANIHFIKDVIPGRHSLDFRMVDVKNASVETWAPLGQYDPLIFSDMDLKELRETAEKNTRGIVASFASPVKIGTMMMLKFDECNDKYAKLISKVPNDTALLPLQLPDSVFCAVQSTDPFNPKSTPQTRRLRQAPENGTEPEVSPQKTNTSSDEQPGTTGQKLDLLPDVGSVPPATACPDSLGSPFIIAGGEVLGILVAVDCHTENVAFFQSQVDGLPPPPVTPDPELIADFKTFFPTLPQAKIWSPRIPMVRGETLRPFDWVPGAGLKPFGAANLFEPSALLIAFALVQSMWIAVN